MSICFKINSNVKLLSLVVQVFYTCFSAVDGYLQHNFTEYLIQKSYCILTLLVMSQKTYLLEFSLMRKASITIQNEKCSSLSKTKGKAR